MARDRLERLSADLDRGFAALEDGRLDEAASILERCQRIDRTHEGVVELGAACADAAGDFDEAIAGYRELAKLRADDAGPRIAIARLELHDLGDPQAALETLTEAFEFIDDEVDLVFGIKLRAEAQLALDDAAAARTSLAELASSVIDDGVICLDLADLALAANDPDAAERFLAVPQKDPELAADALHLLGRAFEQRGQRDRAIALYLDVRARDLAAPAPAFALTDDEALAIATDTFAALPDDIRAKLENVPILIEEVPSEELVKDGVDPRLLGLFQGSSMAEDGALAPTVTNIHLFTKNLARDAHDREDLEDQIRITVIHETAHYFGLEDDDLDALGLG